MLKYPPPLRTIFLLAALCVLTCGLFGCSFPSSSPAPTPTVSEEAELIEAEVPQVTVRPSNNLFGIAWYPSEELNPLLSTNRQNNEFMTLIYESLYTLDQSFEPQPQLAASAESADGITYRITIKSGVVFHDGNPLTAADAVYSLELARSNRNSPYYSRLGEVRSIKAEDDTTLVITLRSANRNLPRLLDVPIICAGSDKDGVPAGTGRYYYDGSGELPYLYVNASWHGGETMPLNRIELIPAHNADDILASLDIGDIDIVSTETAGSDFMHVSSDYSTGRFDTTRLHFLGVNTKSQVFKDARARRAISLAVDRETISASAYDRIVSPATLFANPSAAFYDAELDRKYRFDPAAARAFLDEAGITDEDGDGVRETASGRNRAPVEIRLVTAVGNSQKTRAAEQVASSLRALGLSVDLQELRHDDYINAIKRGNFDLYFGEVRLTADFDIKQLAKSGGALNYGGYRNNNMDALIDRYAKEGADEVFSELAAYVAEEAPFIPICYKSGLLAARKNAASGMESAPGDLYYNIHEWSVNAG